MTQKRDLRRRAEPPECGEYAAVVAHKRAGEELDPACLAADAQHSAEYRQRNPEARRQTVRRQTARTRALAKLAGKYPRALSELIRYERDQDPKAKDRTLRDRAMRRLGDVSYPQAYKELYHEELKLL